jgi:hypothetical protein
MLVSLLGAACGSRTSMLDSDAYSSTGLGGASNVAGSGNTSGNPGKGGSTNAVDPSMSLAACTAYCKGYRVQCSSELGNRDCLETCAEQVNGNGKLCQSLGIEALQCVAPYFPTTGPSQGCSAVTSRAAAACTPELTQFQTCELAPTPIPEPSPLDACEVTEEKSPVDCIRVYECANGPYLVQCSRTNDGAQDCSCIPPAGPIKFAMYGPNRDPCLIAALDCSFL